MNDPRESMEGAPPAGQLTRSLLNVPKRLGAGGTPGPKASNGRAQRQSGTMRSWAKGRQERLNKLV